MAYEVTTPELRAAISLTTQADEAMTAGRIDVDTARTLLKVADAIIRYVNKRTRAAIDNSTPASRQALEGLRTDLAQLRTKLMSRTDLAEIQRALDIIHAVMMWEEPRP